MLIGLQVQVQLPPARLYSRRRHPAPSEPTILQLGFGALRYQIADEALLSELEAVDEDWPHMYEPVFSYNKIGGYRDIRLVCPPPDTAEPKPLTPKPSAAESPAVLLMPRI